MIYSSPCGCKIELSEGKKTIWPCGFFTPHQKAKWFRFLAKMAKKMSPKAQPKATPKEL